MGPRNLSSQQAQPLNFEDILSKEEYLICDTSITNYLTPHSYWIFPARNFSSIPSDFIEKEIESMKLFLELLSSPKVLTTDGVSHEIKNARNNIGDKIHFLSLREDHHLKGDERKRNNGKSDKRIKLEEIQELYHRSYEASKILAFSPSQRQIYSFLEKIVLSVTRNTCAKIDYNLFYQPDRPKTEDFHTDEQLVAVALYLSSIEKKSGGVLTKDSDIKRILRNTIFYLTHSKNQGYREMINLLKDNGIRIYSQTGIWEAILKFDSSWFDSVKMIIQPLKKSR